MEINLPQRYYFFLRQTRKNVKIFSQSVIFYVKFFNWAFIESVISRSSLGHRSGGEGIDGHTKTAAGVM